MICPKFGKSSRGVMKCMTRDGRCNEQHSDRECRIKPIKREGTSMTPRPQQYIIDDDDLAIWRSGCINWRSREDTKCYGCEYAGVESRKGCCEFDDDEMQKIFQSRPAPLTENQKMSKELREASKLYRAGLKDGAAQAREKLFEAIRAERDPHLDYVDWDSIEAAYIRTGGDE